MRKRDGLCVKGEAARVGAAGGVGVIGKGRCVALNPQSMGARAGTSVEAHGVGSSEGRLHLPVHFCRRPRNWIHGQRFVLGRWNESVLGVGDQTGNDFRTPLFLRHSFALHDALDHSKGVVFVVNREARSAADVVCGSPQDSRTYRVERPAPHSLWLFAKESRDPLTHFAGSLVGERNRKDARRINAVVLDEAGDASGEDTRLARARTGQDEHRTLKM